MNRRFRLLGLALIATVFAIVTPLIILPLWSLAGRWPWPDLLPETLSLRGIVQIISPAAQTWSVLGSSVALSLIVALLAALIAMTTARALTFYPLRSKSLIAFGAILPIIVPGTAFAMGAHVIFLHLGLADTFTGVILVHLIYALPYTVSMMLDVTALTGNGLELQAQVLGVPPLKAFIHITLPLLMPGIIASMSMAYIISFSQYFLTLMIGGGLVKTLSIVMVPYIQSGDRTIAAAYAMIFIISMLAVFALLELLARRVTARLSGAR